MYLTSLSSIEVMKRSSTNSIGGSRIKFYLTKYQRVITNKKKSNQ